jgi:phosphate transport system substrate-binding protein
VPSSRVITSAAANDQATLGGSGSTFVEPLVRAWAERYKAVAPNVAIEYTGTNSPAGVEGLVAGEGDFWTSDTPLTELEEATNGGTGAYLQLPWAAGAIAIPYNLPEVPDLRLRPETLAAIFSGKVVRWDDPAVRSDNEGVRLPNSLIQVFHRSDPSGTTYVLSSYFHSVADVAWGLPAAKTIRWVRGTGVAGSSGVVSAVRRTPGAIGYVQLSHAREASLPVARLGNRAGHYQAPTPDAVTAALDTASLRRHSTVVRLNFRTDSPGAYPLATVSYLMFPRAGQDPAKAQALRHFASWAMTEGQRITEPLGYAPVPRQFRVEALLAVEEPPG